MRTATGSAEVLMQIKYIAELYRSRRNSPIKKNKQQNNKKVGAVTQDAYKLPLLRKRTTNCSYIYTSAAEIHVLIQRNLQTCSLIVGFIDSSR